MPDGMPRLFLLDPLALTDARTMYGKQESPLHPAFERLGRDAENALKAGPFTVVSKALTPPSGDKHDYMSLATYWWPNPDTPTGLPYVRRDGETNPEGEDLDVTALQGMSQTVATLALAFWFTGDGKYAERGIHLLDHWFLNPDTRINPNLNHAQFIPGVCDGRGIGIIDTYRLRFVVDAIGVLALSPEWTPETGSGLAEWFSDYLDWLLDSPLGRDECREANNHGTWYDVQTALFALFTGRDREARAILTERVPQRIASQTEPDGRQPRELSRTRSLGYTTMNLVAFMELATMAQGLGIDLWHYETGDGRGIRKALEWLAPYANPEKVWPYAQITPFNRGKLFQPLRRGSIAYGDDAMEEWAGKALASDPSQRSLLLYHKRK